MSEVLLEALMQLFALLTDVKNSRDTGRGKVEEFLARQLSNEYVNRYLLRYDYYIDNFHRNTYSHDNSIREQQWSDNLNRMIEICNELNREVELEAKILILNSLLNHIAKPDISEDEERFVDTLAEHLRINANDYWNLKAFSLEGAAYVADKHRLLQISGMPDKSNPDIKHIYNPKQQVVIWVLHIKCTNTFVFRYKGERNLYLNGHKVEENRIYPMEPGSFIKTSRMRPIDYSNISEKFIARQDRSRIIYRAVDIEYKFSDSQIGIHRFSFVGQSGQLVAIMGGSGTGKSTLLNLMNGNYRLSHGSITINGYNLHTEREMLRGVIGYVPQDDMLNEELTVYENLKFNARLIFNNMSKEKQATLIEKALNDFDLVEARNLKVGTKLNKILSGGQRKRLNIALELMREPSVLFVDEPTSGLSSLDSEKVMLLLKRQVLKGKLVIINIHQPNSDLYKLIDKLLIIDKGGRIIYNGNPMNAIVHFKKKAHYVNPEERECYVCGNVKTEQPFRIIEARMVDPYGRQIRQRKVSAEEWYEQYLHDFEEKFDWKYKEKVQKEKLPPNLYSIPNRLRQFKTYAKRDALKKFKDGQYLLINMFEVPLLACILAQATKYIGSGAGYLYHLNTNIPAYLFMCAVVAIFVGLNVSAEEIIKDRKLLQREMFLNLSRSSYLNSKIMNLMLIAGVQSLLLALIGNYILEIRGMLLGYWIILFSTFVYAIMLGLNISSGLKTAVAIYVSIPLILVPELLFSGTIVNFDRLHPSISDRQYVPRIGDMMISRWAYEALIVHQFKDNRFEKHFFDIEQKRSDASYISASWIPELDRINDECQAAQLASDQATLARRTQLLQSEMTKLTGRQPLGRIDASTYDSDMHADIRQRLADLREHYLDAYNHYNHQTDSIYNDMARRMGGTDKVVAFKNRYVNATLEDWALNRKDFRQIDVYEDLIVRKKQPVYHNPTNNWGRAHFYAPNKRFCGMLVPTPVFNCIFIWVMSGILYVTLYFDLLRRLISYIEHIRLSRMNRRLQKLRI